MLKLVTDKPAETEQPEFDLAKSPACSHAQSLIDRELRVVTCKNCGERLDPFNVLMKLLDYMKGQELRLEYIRNWEESQRIKAQEKEDRRRCRCRRCRKLFKEIPDPETKAFSHCGICNDCWAKNPTHVR